MTMQMDFHYYATYCAALLAGWSHEESLKICYSAQMVDCCSRTLLAKLGAPKEAATTQLQLELMDARTDLVGLQDITRIWASFHFLPYDLYAEKKHVSRLYRNKYRLICKPNGALLVDTVRLAKDKGPQAAGIAMHILADTWAHSYFAGTPSLVINNTNYYFYELLPETGKPTGSSAEAADPGPDESGTAGYSADEPEAPAGDSGESGTAGNSADVPEPPAGDSEHFTERRIRFRHSPSEPDDLEKGLYTNSVYQFSERSIMNLGHGRAGHLPDYSFIRYKYLPAWGDYEEIIKDNPSDYYKAFCQMIYAMKYLRGEIPSFEPDTYDTDAAAPWEEEIREIIARRQLDSCADWKALGEKISGQEVEDFDLEKYQEEYLKAAPDQKAGTFLGSFFLSAMAQKSMVTNRIFKSGSLLAGFSVDFLERGFRGIRDYKKLIVWRRETRDQ